MTSKKETRSFRENEIFVCDDCGRELLTTVSICGEIDGKKYCRWHYEERLEKRYSGQEGKPDSIGHNEVPGQPRLSLDRDGRGGKCPGPSQEDQEKLAGFTRDHTTDGKGVVYRGEDSEGCFKTRSDGNPRGT